MSRRIVRYANCVGYIGHLSLLCPGKLVPKFFDRCRGHEDCPAVCMGHLSRLQVFQSLPIGVVGVPVMLDCSH